MSYAFYYEVPGTEELYQRVKAELGNDRPAGLLVQLVVKSDGGLRHINVWETRRDWQRYRDERIGPAVGKVLAAAGIAGRRPEPVEQPLEVVDVLTGAA
jgi:hypothetical protein